MKQLPLEHFLNYKYLSALSANPARTVGAFTLTQTNHDKNKYESNLWLIKNDQVSQLTSSNKESQFIWLDDETLLFASSRHQDEDALEETSYFKISINGGEAIPTFSLKVSVSQIHMLDEHRFIVLAASDKAHPDLYKMDDKARKEVFQKRKDETYFDIIDQIPWWSNGAQITAGQTSRLFLYDDQTKELTPLTDEHFDVASLYLSDDKKAVYYWGGVVDHVTPLHSKLYQIDLQTQTTTALIESEDWEISFVTELGADLIVLSSDLSRNVLNQNSQYRKYNPVTKSLEATDSKEALVGNSIGSDVRYGGSKAIIKLDEMLLYVATVKDHSELRTFDGKTSTTLLSFDGSIDGFTRLNDQVVVIGQYQTELQELHKIHHEVTTLTQFNREVLQDYYVATPKTFEFESNGDTLTGYVLLPENFDSQKNYPAILDIHGGPKTVYGTIYYHEMQVWANMGYVVFYTNPHGSDGVDDKFSDIYGSYGTIDYEDIMTLTDEVLSRYPNIDAKRLGVTGGSYGGFMTNWIVTHTDRFKVAATQRSISNWTSFYGVSDIGFYFAPDQIHGDVFTPEGQNKLWEHSPMKYIGNAKTPTLVLHSKFDYRCPIDQGYQFFTALTHMGVKTKMVVLNEENHDLSRTGKPKARLVRLKEITQWLDSFLTQA